MAPIGVTVRPKGEHALVHRCDGCGVVRANRVAADDDFALVLRLPPVQRPRRDRGDGDGDSWEEVERTA